MAIAVATVFIGLWLMAYGLWTLIFTFYSQGGVAYTRLALFVNGITSAKRKCEVWPVLLVREGNRRKLETYSTMGACLTLSRKSIKSS